MPGAGLATLAANHPLTLPRGRVVLAKPALGELIRGTSAAVSSLSTALVGGR